MKIRLNLIKLFIVAISLISFSCSENNSDDFVSDEARMELSKFSFNDTNKFYGNVITKVNNAKFDLSIENAFVVNNSWSPYEIIAIPFEKDKDKFYTFFSNHQLSEPFITQGDYKDIIITNIKNEVIATVVNNDQKSVLNNSGFLEIIRNLTNTNSKSICDCHNEESCENHQYDRMENCGAYDFDECMTCAEDVCDQDTKCRYGRTWTGPFYVVSVMAHCAI